MKNHFAIFALPIHFAVDLDELEKKYFALQKNFHPDKSDEIERSIAANEAYEVLRNPLRRASHILQLNGIDLENDEVAPKVDSATLLEIFEMRESGDFNAKDLNKKIKSLVEEAASSLDNNDFAKAAQILMRAKYFDKIREDLKK